MPRGSMLGSTLELRGCRSPMGSPAYSGLGQTRPEDDESSMESEVVLAPNNDIQANAAAKSGKKKVCGRFVSATG